MEEENEVLDIEPGATAAEVASRSKLDEIKARRDARGDKLTIGIPSWGDELRARYRVVDRKEIDRMVRRIRTRANGAAESGPEADIDFLINACTEVVAAPVDGDYDEDEGEHVSNGYNKQLADSLANPQGTDTARGLVAYLFKGNTISISAHAAKVARWMQDTSRSVEDPT